MALVPVSHRPVVLLIVLLCGWMAASPARAHECENGTFSSTFELIQQAIFENRSCADSVCHGSARSGELDLRPGAAYENLIEVESDSVPGMRRVVPGRKELSLLWINLAAKTLPSEYSAPLRAMPLDPVPALSTNELEALRLWIEAGAPEEGVVRGTDELLDACLPPPKPIAIRPLDPPPPGTGVQIKMPRWILPAQNEREVCFASYYDVTDQVPAEFRGPDGTTFRFRRNEIRQDPLSHHLIVNLYTGNAAPSDSAWGVFRCQGGERDGQICDPVEIGACGADSGCATAPQIGVACIGFGPPDAGIGLSSAGISGTQETASEFDFAPGVYREIPLKGMILWNSHAFNLTDEAGKLEAWLNFEFAPPDQQLTPAEQIFNTSQIFRMVVPAFSTDEVCNVQELPPNAYLYELSSHVHQRGKRFRIFDGAWRCDGGPNNGAACSPFGPDLESRDLCGGAACTSSVRLRVGDCNLDNSVAVNELVTAVNIALGDGSVEECHQADGNGDWNIAVNELVTAVAAALKGIPAPVARAPEESLLYVNLLYNDPRILRFDPPRVYDGRLADRSLTYCALYDNGFSDPAEVKKRSTSPPPPIQFPGIGGPCETPTHCTEGQVAAPCAGPSESERNASCDTSPGAGDGFCDACTLRGGVTTEDEMFILLGQYYVPR